jgi:hypothetical protein
MESEPGYLRYYQVYIPINKYQMTNGMHTVKGWTAIGGEVYADFPVSELPADSYVPNATLKYIGDRNPWVPNLTIPDPVIIEKEVIREVAVEVTPRPEVVYEQQLKAQQAIDKMFWDAVADIVKLGVILGAIVAGLMYIGTIIYRGRKEL